MKKFLFAIGVALLATPVIAEDCVFRASGEVRRGDQVGHIRVEGQMSMGGTTTGPLRLRLRTSEIYSTRIVNNDHSGEGVAIFINDRMRAFDANTISTRGESLRVNAANGSNTLFMELSNDQLTAITQGTISCTSLPAPRSPKARMMNPSRATNSQR